MVGNVTGKLKVLLRLVKMSACLTAESGTRTQEPAFFQGAQKNFLRPVSFSTFWRCTGKGLSQLLKYKAMPTDYLRALLIFSGERQDVRMNLLKQA